MLTLVPLSVMASRSWGSVSFHFEELGSIRTTSRAQFRPLATGCWFGAGDRKRKWGSSFFSGSCSFSVSDSTYLFNSFTLLFSCPLYSLLSLSFSPLPQSLGLFLLSSQPFCFSLSFCPSFCPPHIAVSLTLLLDFCGHLPWFQYLPVFVLLSFSSQSL